MVSTIQIYEELRETLDEKAARQIAHYLGAVYEDIQQTATKADIGELRAVVQELAQAQKRTEQQVQELAQAQKRTEEALASLTKRVDGIAQGLRETHRQVGALSHAVGYQLEDRAFIALPRLLNRDHGVDVKGRLVRRPVKLKSGRVAEFNILGEGIREGKPVRIIGEAKTQLFSRDVRKFVNETLVLARAEWGEVLPVLVTYVTPELELEETVKKQGIALYYSYDFAHEAQAP